jgi:hypothetical protein
MSIFLKTGLKSGGQRLINLLHVSSIDLFDKKIILSMSYQTDGIIGNFIFFGGGNPKEHILTYSSHQEAINEFNNIQKTISTYKL